MHLCIQGNSEDVKHLISCELSFAAPMDKAVLAIDNPALFLFPFPLVLHSQVLGDRSNGFPNSELEIVAPPCVRILISSI